MSFQSNVQNIGEESSERQMLPESEIRPLLIDQIKAAEYAGEVILNLKTQGLLNSSNLEHKAILETDIYRLRRGLCLPSAVSTAMNLVAERQVVGDETGDLRVGDYFKYSLPHHGKYVSRELERGWLVVTNTGDMYHHAVVAFAETLGFSAQAVTEFDTLGQFRDVVETGGSVAVSLNNRFVIEKTLAANSDSVIFDPLGNPEIRVQAPEGVVFRKFENGRHVVTIIGFAGDDVILADSFNLPQIGNHGLIVRLPVADANKYLQYFDGSATRGIVITKSKVGLDGLKVVNLNIPNEVREDLSEKLEKYKVT